MWVRPWNTHSKKRSCHQISSFRARITMKKWQKILRARRNGGHQGKKTFWINRREAHTNSKGLRQHVQDSLGSAPLGVNRAKRKGGHMSLFLTQDLSSTEKITWTDTLTHTGGWGEGEGEREGGRINRHFWKDKIKSWNLK